MGEGVEDGRLGVLLLGAGGPRVGLDRFVVPVALAGVVVVVAHAEEVHGGRGPADAVLAQLLELEALAVLAADVHQKGVVRDAEDAGRLTRRHLLVPHVLEGFGQFGVGPRAGRAAAGGGVLALGPAHCKRKGSVFSKKVFPKFYGIL